MVDSAFVGLGVDALTKLVLEVFHEYGKELFENLDFDIALQKALKFSVRRYIQGFIWKYGNIKILNMGDSISIDQIYTDSNLWSGFQGASLFESPEELERRYADSQKDLISFNKEGRHSHPALEFTQKKQRAVVLGGPGAGKSTLLSKVGIEELTRKDGKRKRLLPVFVLLKNLGNDLEVDIKSEIIREFELRGLRHETSKAVSRWLDKGRLLILLDGLDEVPENRRIKIIDAIQEFSDVHRENKFLVSSRPAAYQKRLTNFSDIELAGFDEKQISQTIRNWFREEPSIGIDLDRKINKAINKGVKSLMRNPLLLALTCIVYKQKRHIFPNKTDLYEQAISVLLAEWRVNRNIELEGDLDIYQKEIVLSEVAYQSFCSELTFMYEDWVSGVIEKKLLDMNVDPGTQAKTIMRDLESETGLLVKQAKRVYSFSHETIQEFLAAKYVTSSFASIKSCVTEHLLEERWQDIFVFMSGFRQSRDVIELISRKTNSYKTNRETLKSLLEWVNTNTSESSTYFSEPSRKLQAIYIFLCFFSCRPLSDEKRKKVYFLLNFVWYVAIPAFNGGREIRRIDFPEINEIRTLSKTLRVSRVLIYGNSSRLVKHAAVKDVSAHMTTVFKCSVRTIRQLQHRRVMKLYSVKKMEEKVKGIHDDIRHSPRTLNDCSIFFESISVAWLDLLQLEKSLFDVFGDSSLKQLRDYLHCLVVLRRCGDLDERFSREHWLKIQSEMFSCKPVSDSMPTSNSDPWELSR
jgi:hypothetical protein